MRYLIDLQNGETVTVDDDDDAKLEKLKAEKLEDSHRPRYEQTGAHDPRVQTVEVSGQYPGNDSGAQRTPDDPAPTAPVAKK